MAKISMSGQEGAERPRRRRKVETAWSGQNGDKRPRGRRMAKRDRSIERCRVAGQEVLQTALVRISTSHAGFLSGTWQLVITWRLPYQVQKYITK